jgi:hypothetical protein
MLTVSLIPLLAGNHNRNEAHGSHRQDRLKNANMAPQGVMGGRAGVFGFVEAFGFTADR